MNLSQINQQKELFIVYKCDNWHSNNNSKQLIGVAETLKHALTIIEQFADNEDVELDVEFYYQLTTMLQSQNYEGEGEFIIEIVQKNTLL